MEYKTEYYDEDGNITDNIEDKACAKSLTNLETNKTRYYALSFSGYLYNPLEYEKRKRKLNPIKFVQLTEVAFLLYLRFLRSKNKGSLLQAQRELKG